MSYPVNRIIHHRDYRTFYQSLEFPLEETVQYPYIAGEMQSLIPDMDLYFVRNLTIGPRIAILKYREDLISRFGDGVQSGEFDNLLRHNLVHISISN